MNVDEFIKHFDHVKKRLGGGYSAKCPGHNGQGNGSLSISQKDDKILVHCFAGCDIADILNAVGLKKSSLFISPPKASTHLHSKAQHIKNTDKNGVQLSAYADKKCLPVLFLQKIGLSDCKKRGKNAIRIPYYNSTGEETIVRYRIALTGKDKFRWRSGSKAKVHGLYGLWELDKKSESVAIVEGESDCHTLWHHGYNAVGIPGASIWNEDWAVYFKSYKKIFVFCV